MKKCIPVIIALLFISFISTPTYASNKSARQYIQRANRIYTCAERNISINTIIRQLFRQDLGSTTNYNLWAAYFKDLDHDCYYGFYPATTNSQTSSIPALISQYIDCNDSDNSVYTNQIYYIDNDNDGSGTGSAVSICAGTAPAGYALNNTDCNDSDNTMYPNNRETCDNKDNNCNGIVDDNAINANTYYADTDNDTYGNPALTTRSCSQPTGYVSNNTDCNDSNNAIRPNATEIYYDGIDSNCDGANDYDQDRDGYTSSSYNGNDCDDTNASVHPLAAETYYDGIDSNCSGDSDFDQDGDSYDYDPNPVPDANNVPYPHDGYDCDDSNSNIDAGNYFYCEMATWTYFPFPQGEGYLCSGECINWDEDFAGLICLMNDRVYNYSDICHFDSSLHDYVCELCNN